jgi:hypothetical protein
MPSAIPTDGGFPVFARRCTGLRAGDFRDLYETVVSGYGPTERR